MKREKRIGKWWWLGIIGLIVAGCSLPKLPSEASWDMQLSFPVATQTYGLWELAENDSLFTDSSSTIGMTEPDSSLFFLHAERMDPVYPADFGLEAGLCIHACQDIGLYPGMCPRRLPPRHWVPDRHASGQGDESS